MFDLHNNTRNSNTVSPVAIGANGTKTGVVVDRQGFSAVEFLVSYGAVSTTGTVVTVVAKEGDVTSAMTSIADADLLGTEALAGLPAGTPRTAGVNRDVTKRVGYRGQKRYVSMDIVSTGVTSVGCVAAQVLLGDAHMAPTANP